MRMKSIEVHSKTKTCIFIAISLMSLQLSGCGEFSYKRGAGVADLQLAKKDCQARYEDAVLIEKCLEDSGWIVRDFDKEDPLIAVAFVDNNRSLENPAQAAFSTATPVAQDTALPAASSAVAVLATPDAPQPGPATRTVTPSAPPEKPPAPPKDPMDIFLVSSWWKIGKGPDALKTDTNECVSRLGEQHRPDSATLRTTRGFLICMREKGWRALQAK